MKNARKKTGHIFAILVLWVLSQAGVAWGQTINRIEFPANLCAGAVTGISFGFDHSDNVQIGLRTVALNHSERIFLPDGVSCGSMGCAYESPIEFTQFRSTDSVLSVEDIRYLKLNIEHSYLGDLYIKITCPSGQKSDVLKYSGSGSSSCLNQIPQSSRGWNPGNNSEYVHLGVANTTGTGSSCDSNSHPPGTGWNYCWSNNTTEGYQYGAAGGYVYRSANHVGGAYAGERVDSSNVAAGTQFYHPDESFASLVGCPLNGEWSITVQDGWSRDDGYLFGWELALGTEYTGDTCEVVYRNIEGPYMSRVCDSLYEVDVPPLEHDTVVTYRIWLLNSCGDTIDTTVTVTLRPSYSFEGDTAVCDAFRFYNHNYYESQVIDHNYYSDYGCDSVLHLSLTLHHSDTSYATHRGCLPYEWNGTTYSLTGQYTHETQTTRGCDSLCVLNLTVWGTHEVTVAESVCDGDLPFSFADTAFLRGTVSGVYDFHMLDGYGCDSLVHLDLTVSHTPTLELELRNYHCNAESFKIDAHYDSGALTWSSQPVDPSLRGQEGQSTISIAPTLGTLYTALVETPGTACRTERSLFVEPLPPIEARMRLTPNFATRSRPQVTLQDCSTGTVNQWLWAVDGEPVGNRAQVQYQYPIDRDSVEVMLVVGETRSQCSDTAYGMLRLIGGDLWMPNAFTPDENLNSRFLAKGNNLIQFEMAIYARNGQRVYYSVDMDEGWDGNNPLGQPCPRGTYTYIVRYLLKEAPDNPLTQKGTVLLLR